MIILGWPRIICKDPAPAGTKHRFQGQSNLKVLSKRLQWYNFFLGLCPSIWISSSNLGKYTSVLTIRADGKIIRMARGKESQRMAFSRMLKAALGISLTDIRYTSTFTSFTIGLQELSTRTIYTPLEGMIISKDSSNNRIFHTSPAMNPSSWI